MNNMLYAISNLLKRSCIVSGLFVIQYIFFITVTEAQIYSEDSLIRLLTITREDTSRVMLMAQISEQLVQSNPDSAFTIANQGLKLAKEINFSRGEVYCKFSLARCWWSIGNYANALELLLPEYPEIKKDALLEKKRYQSLTTTYRDQGDYTEALKYAFKVFETNKKFDNCKICRVVNAVIASIYLEKNQPDSANLYIKNGFTYPPAFGYDGWTYLIAGRTQMALKNYASALPLFRISITTLVQENKLKDLAEAYSRIADLFRIIKEKDSAIFYAHKSIEVSKSKKYVQEMYKASLLLSDIYEPNLPDSSLYYFKQAAIAKDTLYSQEKQKQITSYRYNEELRQQKLTIMQNQYRNQIKIYVLLCVIVIFVTVGIILWRSNRQKLKANQLLHTQKKETEQQKEKTEKAYNELKATQAQLIQSEKMASLGELTAGIAHEIQNPLNFVNNFSEVNRELIEEVKSQKSKLKSEELDELLDDIDANLEKINHHGKRADAIVKGMLQHSRQTSGIKEPTDINALCDEYLRLSNHGLRAKDKGFNADFKTDFDESIGKINIVPQDIGRVLLNLFNNAFYAVNEKKKIADKNYKPLVLVQTKKLIDKIEVRVSDNGNGIPQNIIDKIFQPFFTTKPTGQGTGLGLSLAYDIITKEHNGIIKVETREGEGSEFIIQLPLGGS